MSNNSIYENMIGNHIENFQQLDPTMIHLFNSTNTSSGPNMNNSNTPMTFETMKSMVKENFHQCEGPMCPEHQNDCPNGNCEDSPGYQYEGTDGPEGFEDDMPDYQNDCPDGNCENNLGYQYEGTDGPEGFEDDIPDYQNDCPDGNCENNLGHQNDDAEGFEDDGSDYQNNCPDGNCEDSLGHQNEDSPEGFESDQSECTDGNCEDSSVRHSCEDGSENCENFENQKNKDMELWTCYPNKENFENSNNSLFYSAEGNLSESSSRKRSINAEDREMSKLYMYLAIAVVLLIVIYLLTSNK